MQRITVAILEWTKQRTYREEPYLDISGASIIYYPEIPYKTLQELRTGKPEKIQQILTATANFS